MSVFARLVAPSAFLSVVLPIVLVNLLVQVLHLVGLTPYDGQKAAYIISGAYVVAILLESISLLRGR